MNRPIALLALLAACSPSTDECRTILPLTGEAVMVTRTPSGVVGCTTSVDGVTVTTEAHRAGLGWSAGTTWVDGEETRREHVHAQVAAIRTRRDIEAAAASAKAATAEAIKQGRELGRKLVERLKR